MVYKTFMVFSETLRDKSLFNNSLALFAGCVLIKNRQVRHLSITPHIDNNFVNWFAGLIDSDGGFYISKAGYASCEITMAAHEKDTLDYVQSRLGGTVTPR